jgi:Tfp pilus assembly protein PilF
MLYLELGRTARARRYLERSLRADPEDPATRRALARLAAAERTR